MHELTIFLIIGEYFNKFATVFTIELAQSLNFIPWL